MTQTAVNLFSGADGWGVGARGLDLDIEGIEIDPDAVQTARAAGHRVTEIDVLKLDPCAWVGVDAEIGSPPCQTFSLAGAGAGRRALDEVMRMLPIAARGQRARADHLDVRTLLVLEPLRWAVLLRPRWIALEQVPPVLPIWQAYAEVLRGIGYSVAVDVLCAEQYGVPQTRKRAILIASRDREVRMPIPTHSRYHSRNPTRLDLGVKPWVSMAEALGWGRTASPAPTVCGGGADTGGADPFGPRTRRELIEQARDGVQWVQRSNYSAGGQPGQTAEERGRTIRTLDQPSVAITSKGGQWESRCFSGAGPRSQERVGQVPRELDEPAHTITGMGNGYWMYEWPATTVQGDPRIGRPGHKDRSSGGESQFANASVRITREEAAVLQTFPVDYPWQGNKTAQYKQIGNAIPPLLARAVLAAAIKDASLPDQLSAALRRFV